MTTRLGPNVHSIGLKDKVKLLRWLVELQPRATLVMDNHALAKEIKLLIPACAVVHRAYKEGDHLFHHTMSVQAFYDNYARWGEGGIIVQALNEPSPDNNTVWDWRRLADWVAALMDKFGPQGLALGWGSFGTGSPHESIQSLSALDAAWEAQKRWNHQHYLCTHGYGTLNGMTYTDETHTRDVIPWRIGREATFIIPYCQQKFDFAPRVIQTEFGTDVSFYPGDDSSKSGWKSIPWTPDQYADELIKADQYDNHPWMIGRCIFSYGNSGGWEKYDIEDADVLHDRLTEYSKSQDTGGTTMPVPVPKPANAGVGIKVSVNPPLEFVNLRDGPATTYIDIGDVRKGQIVTWYKDTKTPGGWYWIEGDKNGWISDLEGKVTFTPVVEPVPVPEPIPDLAALLVALTRRVEALEAKVEGILALDIQNHATLQNEHMLLAQHASALEQMHKASAEGLTAIKETV